jgi:post-segregation antitoxin (ccd killing protein)
MAAPLNIRDIGPDRKAAIEAAAAGPTISDLVRDWIDAGITRARADREYAAWIAAAKQGLAEEARHLELNGPSLAQFRQF